MNTGMEVSCWCGKVLFILVPVEDIDKLVSDIERVRDQRVNEEDRLWRKQREKR